MKVTECEFRASRFWLLKHNLNYCDGYAHIQFANICIFLNANPKFVDIKHTIFLVVVYPPMSISVIVMVAVIIIIIIEIITIIIISIILIIIVVGEIGPRAIGAVRIHPT